MMKKALIFWVLLLNVLQAQNVGIGTNNPHH